MTERKRDGLFHCTCQSFCTKFNKTTHRYEGPGNWIKESLKSAHSRADRMRRLEEEPMDQTAPNFNLIPVNNVHQIRNETLWLLDVPAVFPHKPLVFVIQPALADFKDPEEIYHPSNSKYLLLQGVAHANASYLFAETRLKFLAEILLQESASEERNDVAGFLQDSLMQFAHLKVSEWKKQRAQEPGKIIINTDTYFFKKGPIAREARSASVLCLVLQHMYRATRRALRVHLSGVRSILSSSGTPVNVVETIPRDPRTCSSSFNIDGAFKQYFSCPSCHCLYPYGVTTFTEGPVVCSYRQTPSSEECGTQLWKEIHLTGGLSKHVPLRKYYHHDIKDWLGRLLARPGVEDLLISPTLGAPDPKLPIEDIWSSKVFLNLKDARGEPFYPGQDGACRLVFGLSVDGFVPYGSKTQSASSTGIWLVLMNLPPHLRHLPQYLFLAGVIPGPDKPSKDQINHYIQLVINDFLELWAPGVTFTRTYKYRMGRLVEAIIVPVICDHPGLRQVIGYAGGSTSHNLCTACDIDIDDIYITDRVIWPKKDSHRIRHFATMWKNAKSEDHQEAIFNAFGWRWSPLFDLPYWDPVKFSVVDSMHALDLNLFNNHCRNLFQIDLKHLGGDRASAMLNPVSKRKVLPLDNRDVRECRKVLIENSPTLLFQLLEFERPVLFAICTAYNVLGQEPIIIGSRQILSQNLHVWRLRLNDPSILQHPSDKDGQPSDDSQVENLDSHRNEGGLADSLSSNDDAEVADEERTGICTLDALNGEQKQRYISLLNSLLLEGTPEAVHTARANAFSQARVPFYSQIASEFELGLPRRPTKDVYHQAICDAIDEHAEFREFLQNEVQLATADTSNSGTESEMEEMDVDPDIDSDAPSIEDSLPLEELNGSKQERAKALRVIRHLLSIGGPSEKKKARENALAGSVNLYKDICSLLSITLPERTNKKARQAAILLAIDTHSEKRQLLERCLPDPKHDAVLGSDVMNIVWDVMRNTTLPSWISPPPRNWGTAKRGTLSANNWRVICTIHLPVTLIWIWRNENSRKIDLIQNFMDLVTAARIASLRRLLPVHIEEYNFHMTRYVKEIQVLYPSQKLKPTHHTAMHIGDTMENFGPDHSHNALFYERHIRELGLLNTNNKPGQMESTFVKSSAQYSHVCALLEDDQRTRNDMQEMIDKIESIRKEDLRGFRLASILDPNTADYDLDKNAKAAQLDSGVLDALRYLQHLQGITPSNDGYIELPSVGLGGMRYASIYSSHSRDSSVIFLANADQNQYSTGIIQLVFLQRSPNKNYVYLVVDEYDSVSQSGGHDPFRTFGFAAGYLCEGVPSRRHVITASQVVSHFILSYLPDTDCFHALPFDRTMFSYDPSESRPD